MTDITITAADLDADGYYKADSLTSDGSIIIEAGMGVVRFRGNVIAAGSIIVKAGSGIEAGLGIKAGWDIKAGLGIEAKTISSNLRIFAGTCLWKTPSPEEMEIRAEIISGEVCYGTVVDPARESAEAGQ